MLKTLLVHEIQNLLKSKRIYMTVLMFLILFASVFIVRVIDYQKQINQYIADVKISEEALQNAENYSHINPRAIKQPLVFSIYNQGFKFTNVISIQYYEPILASTSLNEENNPTYIENNQLDITFLITFFLSLFILLISYDSINGEKHVGTLRLLLTYPLKRQSFILKKILGVFIFIAITFSIPYILSLISLVITYANLLSMNFFLSAFFYWFLVLLFIFFFSLLGIFISCCTSNPNRSLVYSLLVWILLSIVLPISWDYILAPMLYNERLHELEQIYRDKNSQNRRIMFDNLPDDVDPYQMSYMLWNGDFYHCTIWSYKETHEQRNRYQKYLYDNYYPASRDTEQAIDTFYRKQINIDNVRNWIFSYNPIVLFGNLSTKITGNGREDYLKLLQNCRDIRDELVNLGISEGWLLDTRFHRAFSEEYDLGYSIEYYSMFKDWDPLWAYILELRNSATPYEMELPFIRKYEQPRYTFGEIFARIWQYLSMFVVSILVQWGMTYIKFMRYDVR